MTDHDSDAPKAVRRLKHWPIELKRRIVEETFAPGASVSVVARRHDANSNQVFDWRKKYRHGTLRDRKAIARTAAPVSDLIRIGVVDHAGGIRPLPEITPEIEKATALPESRSSGVIEIELHSGIKVRVDAGIDEAALRRVLVVIGECA
jgi:transposase